MTITYRGGNALRAIQLSRVENTLRVAVPGEEDARVFRCIEGTWLSEDCEVVEIEFEWQRKKPRPILTEEDFICPKELAQALMEPFQSPEIESLEEPLRKLARAAAYAAGSGTGRVS
jgi:hypothetical protein